MSRITALIEVCDLFSHDDLLFTTTHHTSISRPHQSKPLFNRAYFISNRTNSLRIVWKTDMNIGMSWTAFGSHWGNSLHGKASQTFLDIINLQKMPKLCHHIPIYMRSIVQNAYLFRDLQWCHCHERNWCKKSQMIRTKSRDRTWVVCTESISFGFSTMRLWWETLMITAD